MRQHEHQADNTANDVGAEHDSLARRNLLRLGGIAAAGAAAAAVATAVNATPADATTGAMQYGSGQDAGADQTELLSNSDYSLVVKNYKTTGFGASILGWTNQPGNPGMAIYGYNTGGGHGVVGEVDSPANPNPGVEARVHSGTGPALRAIGKAVPGAAGVGAGNAAALDVRGRANFNRSGLLTIPAGSSDAFTGLVAGGLASTARVLATMQTVVAANVAVKSAVPILSGANKGRIQIYLNTAAPTSGVKVAWFVFG